MRGLLRFLLRESPWPDKLQGTLGLSCCSEARETFEEIFVEEASTTIYGGDAAKYPGALLTEVAVSVTLRFHFGGFLGRFLAARARDFATLLRRWKGTGLGE
jgi:hypothetical protein